MTSAVSIRSAGVGRLRKGRRACLPAALSWTLLASAVLAAPASGHRVLGGGERWQAQAGGARFNADDPLWLDEDTLDIEQPADWPVYAYYDVYANSFSDPGDPQQKLAVNINTLGEVPDSSWFENRLGRRELSVDEIVRGPNIMGGPAAGTWKVIGRPSGGVTPKFLIEDAAGARFILKFDPVDYPEIASTAEMVSSRFFHAFGFHVAEAYVVTLSKDRLEIGPGATFTSDTGLEREIDQIDLDHWMSNAPESPDGTYRALASRFVEGVGVGEFRFFGTRSDDPNDIFPHEHRRELRGYRVMAAWLNHDDSRALNTYDAYVQESGRRFVKHYVLDFGSTLGSASIGANAPRGGNEYFLEGAYFWKSMATLGIWSRPWLHAEFPDYPAVGKIEADVFRPDAWKAEYPNAAFDHMDAADGFWAARIVSRFSDEAVRRVVAGAQISDPGAESYLADVLLKRRDKVVAYWITQTNPLDDFALSDEAGSLTLRWDNAAIRVAAAKNDAGYRVRWSSFDNRTGGAAQVSEHETGEPASPVPSGAWGTTDSFGYRYARAHIFTRHVDFPHWERPVIVTLRDRGGDGTDIVGIERPREFPE